MFKAEVNIVDCVFVPFKFVTLLSFSLGVTIIVKTKDSVPGGSNYIILVITPVAEAGYVLFFFVSLFLWLLELFHFYPVLDVYAIDSASLVTNK